MRIYCIYPRYEKTHFSQTKRQPEEAAADKEEQIEQTLPLFMSHQNVPGALQANKR